MRGVIELGTTKYDITKLIVDFEPEITHIEVHFDGDDRAYFDVIGRMRKKSFPASKSLVDILKEDLPGFLLW